MDPKTTQKPGVKETPAAEAALAKQVADLKAQLAQAQEDAKAAEAKAAAGAEKAQAKAEGEAFKAEILSAVSKLRHGNAADWQEDGRPSLNRIIQLAGNNKITAEDVARVAGDVRREVVNAEDAKAAALLKGADDVAPDEELSGALVRAIEPGQYGGKLREVGDEFTYSGPKRAWFVKLKG